MIGEICKPALVLLPIGGNFTILAGKPEDFAKGMEGSGVRVVVPQPGDAVTF